MIIIIGIAGAGKSTQGQLLAQRLSCPWLSVGQLLRQNMDEAHKQRMLAGEMVEDEQLIPILNAELKRLGADKNEIILDGSPRTRRQAEWLAGKVKSGEVKMTAVVHLSASKQTVKDRLLKRGRPDDTEAAIDQRFLEYDRTIVPILDYLRTQDFKIYDIDGTGPAEKDAELIKQALGF
ncbi:nucleoside monophosphate kinase [Candidatus Saccharibacteria bacterium]|nr:nucleoside monophosphate kinase [Candidatus Saccharibacteria bacterium]